MSTPLMASMFSLERICDDCGERETQHPKYHDACTAVARAWQGGNLNFAGIGRPADL